MGTSTFDTYTAVPLDTAVVKVQHVSDEHHNKYTSKYSHRSRTSRDLLEYSLFLLYRQTYLQPELHKFVN